MGATVTVAAAASATTAAAVSLEPVPVEVEQPEVVSAAAPAFDQIAALAYSYWEARGRQGGCPQEDWLRAEQELRATSAR